MVGKILLDSLYSAWDLRVNKAIKQLWKEKKYSYLDTPRPDFGLMLLLSGRVDFVTEEKTVSATAGSVVFLPKNCYYEARITDHAEDYLLCFDIQGTVPCIASPTILFEKASLSCSEAFRSLVEAGYASDAGSFKTRGLFYLLLDAMLSEAQAGENAQARLVQKARTLLEEDPSLSMAALAKQCAVSQSGLRRLFGEYTGVSPIEYRTRVKIKQAAYLLESTDLSVDAIAARLDFFDAAYFCKVFRESKGLTPNAHRRNKKL